MAAWASLSLPISTKARGRRVAGWPRRTRPGRRRGWRELGVASFAAHASWREGALSLREWVLEARSRLEVFEGVVAVASDAGADGIVGRR